MNLLVALWWLSGALLGGGAGDLTLMWDHRHGDSYYSGEEGWRVTTDAGGNAYVTGQIARYTLDIATLKLSAGGELQWVMVKGSQRARTDWPVSIGIHEDAVYVLASLNSQYGYDDFGLLKYDAATGELLWELLYDHREPDSSAEDPRSMAIDPLGNIIAVGSVLNLETDTSYDYLTVKFAPDGTVLWARTFDLFAHGDGADTVTVDGAGNVYVSGNAFDGTTSRFTTLKYSPDGDLLWQRMSSVAALIPRRILLDSLRNVIVAGGPGFAVVKYSADGDLLWEREHDLPFPAQLRALAIGADDAICVTGSMDPDDVNDPADYVTAVYEPDGTLRWLRQHNGGLSYDPRDYATVAVADPAGGYLISGKSKSDGEGYVWTTLHYSQFGDILGSDTYDGDDGPIWAVFLPEDLKKGADGGFLFLTGGIGGDIGTLKYEIESGPQRLRRPGRPVDPPLEPIIPDG